MRSALLARNLTQLHTAPVVYLTCNEAFFVDLQLNPFHRARLERLGLAQADRVFALLGAILEPTDAVR